MKDEVSNAWNWDTGGGTDHWRQVRGSKGEIMPSVKREMVAVGEERHSVKGKKCGRTYRRTALTLSPQSVLTSFGLRWPQNLGD